MKHLSILNNAKKGSFATEEINGDVLPKHGFTYLPLKISDAVEATQHIYDSINLSPNQGFIVSEKLNSLLDYGKDIYSPLTHGVWFVSYGIMTTNNDLIATSSIRLAGPKPEPIDLLEYFEDNPSLMNQEWLVLNWHKTIPETDWNLISSWIETLPKTMLSKHFDIAKLNISQLPPFLNIEENMRHTKTHIEIYSAMSNFDDFLDSVPWDEVSKSELSNYFILKYANYLNFSDVFHHNPNVSNVFLRNNFVLDTKESMRVISSFQNMSTENLMYYSKFNNWRWRTYLWNVRTVTYEQFLLFEEEIKDSFKFQEDKNTGFIYIMNLPTEVLKKHLDILRSDLNFRGFYGVYQFFLAKRQGNLTTEILRDYIDLFSENSFDILTQFLRNEGRD